MRTLKVNVVMNSDVSSNSVGSVKLSERGCFINSRGDKHGHRDGVMLMVRLIRLSLATTLF